MKLSRLPFARRLSGLSAGLTGGCASGFNLKGEI